MNDEGAQEGGKNAGGTDGEAEGMTAEWVRGLAHEWLERYSMQLHADDPLALAEGYLVEQMAMVLGWHEPPEEVRRELWEVLRERFPQAVEARERAIRRMVGRGPEPGSGQRGAGQASRSPPLASGEALNKLSSVNRSEGAYAATQRLAPVEEEQGKR